MDFHIRSSHGLQPAKSKRVTIQCKPNAADIETDAHGNIAWYKCVVAWNESQFLVPCVLFDRQNDVWRLDVCLIADKKPQVPLEFLAQVKHQNVVYCANNGQSSEIERCSSIELNELIAATTWYCEDSERPENHVIFSDWDIARIFKADIRDKPTVDVLPDMAVSFTFVFDFAQAEAKRLCPAGARGSGLGGAGRMGMDSGDSGDSGSIEIVD